MHNTTTLKKHAALVDRMAQALDLDLEELALRGDVSISAIEDAVLSCTGCSKPEACQQWLDTKAEAAHATPGYCRNSGMFAALKRGDSWG